MVVALPVELARAAEFKPCLKVLADGAVEQGSLTGSRAYDERPDDSGATAGTPMPPRPPYNAAADPMDALAPDFLGTRVQRK